MQNKHSTNDSLINKIISYIQANYSTFYLQTAEVARADRLIENIAHQLNLHISEYNLSQGRVNFQNKSLIKDNQGKIEQSLLDIYDEDLENRLILIKNAKLALEHNPLAISRLQYLIEKVERHNQFNSDEPCAIILQSAEVYMPVDIEPYITLLEMPLPQEDEIKLIIQQQAGNISEKFTARLATSLSGLNELEIQKLLTLIQNQFEKIEEDNEEIFSEIQRQKEQIIAKSGVLEMVKVDSNIHDIGGLENLKKWLKDQSEILNHLEEARAFGVKAPKGTLIAGMPGCGKSLTAKAASQLFQQPLLRLDIGSLLGKYVGESETNMRKALAMAESISPCVLWVDELEKAFVGMSGNNASEVSSRLLGYFLTWMQEKTKPVFIVATANDITALPPELLRKGRFDEIFYVGFPNNKERRQILEIHLKKAKQNSENLPLAELAQLCRDYSGADIENAVYDGVKNAFINKSPLTSELLKQAIQHTTPLRKTMKDKVGEYEKKFEELYLTPASQKDGLSIAQMIKMSKSPNYLERIKVAESEDVTEDILAELVKDEKLEVRKAVFNNPICPTKLLDEQISLEKGHSLYNEEILTSISKHPNVSFGLALNIFKKDTAKIENIVTYQDLSSITTDELKIIKITSSIQKKIAQNPYISEQLFDYLLKQNQREVKNILLVNNSKLPKRQEKFANDSDPQIRRELAKNLDLTIKVQEKLSNDSDLLVKQHLAENKNLNEDLILKIIQKDEPEINKIIAQRVDLSEEIKNILLEISKNQASDIYQISKAPDQKEFEKNNSSISTQRVSNAIANILKNPFSNF